MTKHVVAGILYNNNNVLLCQRKRGSRYELFWEFPGGKVEENETADAALIRELQEELSITITSFTPLREYKTEYNDGGVFTVTFYLVTQWQGEPHNNVFEDMKWCTPTSVLDYNVLEGNIPICKELPTLLK